MKTKKIYYISKELERYRDRIIYFNEENGDLMYADFDNKLIKKQDSPFIEVQLEDKDKFHCALYARNDAIGVCINYEKPNQKYIYIPCKNHLYFNIYIEQFFENFKNI